MHVLMLISFDLLRPVLLVIWFWPEFWAHEVQEWYFRVVLQYFCCPPIVWLTRPTLRRSDCFGAKLLVAFVVPAPFEEYSSFFHPHQQPFPPQPESHVAEEALNFEKL